jgi:hypothetical protein
MSLLGSTPQNALRSTILPHSHEELQQMDEEEEVLFEMIEKRKEEILARMRLKKVIAIIEKDAAKL